MQSKVLSLKNSRFYFLFTKQILYFSDVMVELEVKRSQIEGI